MKGRDHGPPPGARWIRWASRLVPGRRREAWRREWEAELVFAWRRLTDTGRPSIRARWRLRRRALACTLDALDRRWQTMTMNGLWSDVRIAVRSLTRAPGFATAALVTLTLGIGASTAVFSLVDGVLLRPLPFEEPDDLVELGHRVGAEGDRLGTSEGLFLVYAEHARTLEGIALHRVVAANLATDGEPRRAPGAAVTPGFFDVLRARPTLGRTFSDAEGRPGADPVVVLGDALWRSAFGADPHIVGTSVRMDGVARRVVGVMPAGFAWPDRETRFWVPIAIDPTRASVGNFVPGAVARLAEDASLEAVRAEAATLLSRLPDLLDGAAFLQEAGLAARIVTLKESVVGEVRGTVWVLVGTVAFVLLIACANVANLLLVRTQERSRELAVRVALGASRIQLGRTVFLESALLALGGAGLGLVVAGAAVTGAVRMAPAGIPRITEVGVDGRAVLVALLLAGGMALLFGILPMLRYGSSRIAERLRSGGTRGGSGGRDRQRLRSVLVVAQVSLALVLLVGAGLMVRSVWALRAVEPGFDDDGVLAVRLTIPGGEVADARATEALQRRLVERVSRLSRVEASGLVSDLPLSGGSHFNVELEDHPRGPDDLPIMSHVRWASAGYFETMGIPILEGRSLRREDDAAGRRGVVVSQAFAERWWPGRSALGRRVRTGFDDGEWWEVVGVSAPVHLQRLDVPAEEAIYFPTLSGPAAAPRASRSLNLVVRVTGDPLSILPSLRAETAALHARVPLSAARTMTRVLADSTARTAFTTAVLAAAASVALILGVVGIYGVVAYVVSRRTREIGVRMALGARAGTVQRMVVRQGLGLAAIGVVLGLVGAVLLSSFLASLTFGVAPTDPVTYAVVSTALVAVAWFASWVPAARAARIPPSRALESE